MHRTVELLCIWAQKLTNDAGARPQSALKVVREFWNRLEANAKKPERGLCGRYLFSLRLRLEHSAADETYTVYLLHCTDYFITHFNHLIQSWYVLWKYWSCIYSSIHCFSIPSWYSPESGGTATVVALIIIFISTLPFKRTWRLLLMVNYW